MTTPPTRATGQTAAADPIDLRAVAGWRELGIPDLVGRYRVAIETLDPRVFELEHETLDRGFEAECEADFGLAARIGRWPCRFLLCHLADAELVFAHRIRRALSEESPMLALWDHAAFWDSPLYGQKTRGPGGHPVREPVGALAALVHTVRGWMAATLYQIDDADWARRAMHPELGELTVRDLVCYQAWHFEHHGRLLNGKVEHLLGPRPAPGERPECDEGRQAGGCGPGCGCVGS